MASKRNAKAIKRGKKVKNLAVKSKHAKGVKGGINWGDGALVQHKGGYGSGGGGGTGKV